jgi:SAM-dependent methyltransferase
MITKTLPVSVIVHDSYLYEREYFEQYYNDPKRAKMYLLEHKRILEYFPNGGTILDVGCGVGGFLSVFDDRWTKYGVEPSEFARDIAAKKNITILHSIDIVDFEQFDVVVFRGSLQHINFPMASLVHAARSLKPGGLLVILATPDIDSLVYKLWGRLPALDAPRNWILFGGKFLSNILQRLEFEQIKILHPYLNTPYANPISDFFKFFISIFFGWRPFAFPGNQMEIYAVKK